MEKTAQLRMRTYSVVIPTYNEAEDIQETLLSIIGQDNGNVEVVVVDDSSDNTVEKVNELNSELVRVYKRAHSNGRAGARNDGIREASGEVVVILNADVRLPDDFFKRLDSVYDRGFDCVTVGSEVANKSHWYGRYINAWTLSKEDRGVFEEWRRKQGFYWSEGFSVKRGTALKTSLFPINEHDAILAGEDVVFIDELRNAGAKGIIERKIIVSHIVPEKLMEIARNRIGRGRGTPQVYRYVLKRTKLAIALSITIKLTWRLSRILLLTTYFHEGIMLGKHMRMQGVLRGIFVAGSLRAVELACFSYGEILGFLKLE